MTTQPPEDGKLNGKERRSWVDRRLVDKGPPGKHDRRRHIDARQPETKELDMSDSEWALLSQDSLEPGK